MSENNRKQEMEFSGKVVLITGAGSGIGAAAAESFATRGAILSLIDMNGEWLEKTAAKMLEIIKDSKKLLTTVGDLTDESVCVKFVGDSLASFGKIDILCNVAGVFFPDTILDFNLKTFRKTLEVNLVAPFHLSGLCAKHLVETKGCIVNVSSTASTLAAKDAMAYFVSKAGLDSLTRCMALDFGPHQVRVNSIRPGGTYTNIGASHSGQEVPRSVMDQTKSMHVLNRVAEASEVAEMMVIMASEKCSFMTGTNLLFDGGLTAMGPGVPKIEPEK